MSKSHKKTVSKPHNVFIIVVTDESRSVHGPLSVPTDDICSLCYTFAQSHKYGSRTVDNPDSSFDSDDDELDLADTKEVPPGNGSVTRENVPPSIEHRENELIAATKPVREAQAMRK